MPLQPNMSLPGPGPLIPTERGQIVDPPAQPAVLPPLPVVVDTAVMQAANN